MTDIYAERYRDLSQEAQTCCLTGHRVIPPGEEKKIMVRTKNIILRLIREKNVRFFGVGGAVGFDMLASEYLLDLKAHDEHQIRIISVLPYPAWRETEDWTDELRAREEKILLGSDKVVYVRNEYEKNVKQAIHSGPNSTGFLTSCLPSVWQSGQSYSSESSRFPSCAGENRHD